MMNRRQHLKQYVRLGMGLGLGLGLVSGILGGSRSSGASNMKASTGDLHWQEKVFQGFGTTLWLRAAHHNTDVLEQALHAAVLRVQAIEQAMSLFNPHSELSRLNATASLRHASTDLCQILRLGRSVAQHSGGAFDVSTQPLWLVWSAWAEAHAGQERKVVSEAWRKRIAAARAKVDWRGVRVYGHEVHLQSGMALSLNGIAQGYAADQAQAVLKAHGIAHAMLDTGETALIGQSPQGPWRLGVLQASGATGMSGAQGEVRSQAGPAFWPQGRAVATSTDDQTWFTPDHQHHHIFDPRSGYSPSHWAHVTVLAPSAALADALTKVFFMCPPHDVLRLAKAWGVDALLRDKAGQWLVTPGVQRVT